VQLFKPFLGSKSAVFLAFIVRPYSLASVECKSIFNKLTVLSWYQVVDEIPI